MTNYTIYDSPKILVTKNTVKIKVSLPKDFANYKSAIQTYSIVNIIGVSVIRENVNKLIAKLITSIIFLPFPICMSIAFLCGASKDHPYDKPSFGGDLVSLMVIFLSLAWFIQLLYWLFKPRYFLQFSTGDGEKTVLVDHSKKMLSSVKIAVEKAISEQ